MFATLLIDIVLKQDYNIINLYIMKKLKILMSFIYLFFALLNFAQTSESRITSINPVKITKGVFKFENEILDYGTILQNSEGSRKFTFKNIGKKPIIITKIKGSCGCTVAAKPEKPIMPGETASIKVKYATNKLGSFNKSFTVTSNANEGKKIIRIKGKVIKGLIN